MAAWSMANTLFTFASLSSRRLSKDGSSKATGPVGIKEEADRFTTELAIYTGSMALLSIVVLGCISFCNRRSKSGRDVSGSMAQRIFNRWYIRGMLTLLFVLFCLMPVIVMSSCCIFGLPLALVEGWRVLESIQYLIQFAMGLQNPLTEVAPESYFGMACDLLIGVWNMLVVATATGLATKMLLVTQISGQAPESFLGFLRYLFIYVPIVVVIVSCFSGAIMAAVEGWPYIDGIFYMAGDGLGVAIESISPETTLGHVVECIFKMAEIGFVAGIFGLVADHRLTECFVDFLEGVDEEVEDNARFEDDDSTEVKLEAEAAMSMEDLEELGRRQQQELWKRQEALTRTRKVIFMKTQPQLEPGSYVVIAPGVEVLSTEEAGSPIIETMCAGATVQIVEVKTTPGQARVCGRIARPEGWICLRDTESSITAIPDFPVHDANLAVQSV